MKSSTCLLTLLVAALLGSCTPTATAPPTPCVPGKDFIIIQAVTLKNNVKIAVVKTVSRQYELMRLADKQCEVIPTKQSLPRNEYTLDSVQTAAGLTTIRVFRSQEGEMLAQGFVFSGDDAKHFRYVDQSDISPDIPEGIKRIRLDSVTATVLVDLYSLEPAWRFLSTDSCRSWRVRP